ncbi:MAG: cyclase family protein [Dehalococcoidales bacterium]|nr:cyclase family protein [Dehalococcoidales bacterium]
MTADKLSNWGKWGADDQRGTLNYITKQAVQDAFRMVQQGRIYSLGATLGGRGPFFTDVLRREPWRFTSVVNIPCPSKTSWAEDMITMSTHSGTHIDALCHVWYENRLYNGFPADEINGLGTKKNSIENVKSLIGRGILLDIAGYKGLPHLERSYAITPQDMENCLKAEKLETKPGDIILVRTGWLNVFYEQGPEIFHKEAGAKQSGEPGLSHDIAGWLHLRQTCAIGMDNYACEVQPSQVEGFPLPFHAVFLRDMGGYLIEFMNLEELAHDKVYEFLFMAAPIQFSRGCGSPINPLAII